MGPTRPHQEPLVSLEPGIDARTAEITDEETRRAVLSDVRSYHAPLRELVRGQLGGELATRTGAAIPSLPRQRIAI